MNFEFHRVKFRATLQSVSPARSCRWPSPPRTPDRQAQLIAGAPIAGARPEKNLKKYFVDIFEISDFFKEKSAGYGPRPRRAPSGPEVGGMASTSARRGLLSVPWHGLDGRNHYSWQSRMRGDIVSSLLMFFF